MGRQMKAKVIAKAPEAFKPRKIVLTLKSMQQVQDLLMALSSVSHAWPLYDALLTIQKEAE